MDKIFEKKRHGSYTRFLLAVLTVLSLIWNSTAQELIHRDVSHTPFYLSLVDRNIVVADSRPHQLWSRQDSNDTTPNNPGADLNSPLPVPFDTSLGSNFTDSACPNYFSSFLSDETFQTCLPISLLLQNSMSFFQTLRSQSLLQKTISHSCSATLSTCSPYMQKVARDLISSGNCQVDYQRQNPIVMQALSGLRAYEAIYQATCLTDSSNQKNCFMEAMESDNADDMYPYYTAIGLSMPPSAKPSCKECLRQTMNIFKEYAVQDRQPLAETYNTCASQLNGICGSGFVTAEIKTATKVKANSATFTGPSKRTCLLSLGIATLWTMI